MSEHDSHDDPTLSALYRRISQEAPSAQLDERVMESARRHAARRSHRWWLPLSTAAVLVLAVTLLLRHQQAPDELQRELAQLGAAVQATPSASAPTAPPPAAPREEAPVASAAPVSPAPAAPRREAPLAKSMVADAPPPEAEKKRELAVAAEQQAKTDEAVKPPEALSAVPAQADEMRVPAERSRSAMAPQAAAGVAPQRNEAAEAPEPWLKRIEALRVKGEIETAKRELAEFRKAYPAWPLPKELQPLLPEAK